MQVCEGQIIVETKNKVLQELHGSLKLRSPFGSICQIFTVLQSRIKKITPNWILLRWLLLVERYEQLGVVRCRLL